MTRLTAPPIVTQTAVATSGSGGGATLLAVLSIALAVLVLTGGGGTSARLSRLARALSSPRAAMSGAGKGMGARSDSLAGRRRLVAAGLAGLGITLVVGGPVGLVLGGVAAVAGARVLAGLEPREVRARRERVARDLPAAAGLLAGAVTAGATPVAGIEAVAAAVGGPLGSDLRRVAALSRLGGDVSAAWRGAGADAQLAPLARTISRAVDTGAPLAAALDRLATDLHAERRSAIDLRARTVGVRAAAPLGLCFLPAFLLIGVVPVVAGIAGAVLGVVL